MRQDGQLAFDLQDVVGTYTANGQRAFLSSSHVKQVNTPFLSANVINARPTQYATAIPSPRPSIVKLSNVPLN